MTVQIHKYRKISREYKVSKKLQDFTFREIECQSIICTVCDSVEYCYSSDVICRYHAEKDPDDQPRDCGRVDPGQTEDSTDP